MANGRVLVLERVTGSSSQGAPDAPLSVDALEAGVPDQSGGVFARPRIELTPGPMTQSNIGLEPSRPLSSATMSPWRAAQAGR